MPHILLSSINETFDEETGDYYLSFTMPLPGLLSQQKYTQTGRDDLLSINMMNPLFSFLLWLEAGGSFLAGTCSSIGHSVVLLVGR